MATVRHHKRRCPSFSAEAARAPEAHCRPTPPPQRGRHGWQGRLPRRAWLLLQAEPLAHTERWTMSKAKSQHILGVGYELGGQGSYWTLLYFTNTVILHCHCNFRSVFEGFQTQYERLRTPF